MATDSVKTAGTCPNGKVELEWELRGLDGQEKGLGYRIEAPESLPEGALRPFELSNIVRLGLAQEMQETFAGTQSLDVPVERERNYVTVDFDLEIESTREHILTELGELS